MRSSRCAEYAPYRGESDLHLGWRPRARRVAGGRRSSGLDAYALVVVISKSIAARSDDTRAGQIGAAGGGLWRATGRARQQEPTENPADRISRKVGHGNRERSFFHSNIRRALKLLLFYKKKFHVPLTA